MDNSGSISAQEAMWLGIALSLDAFGAGLGAALLGFPTLWTALIIALFSGAFLSLGMKVGLRFSGSALDAKTVCIASAIVNDYGNNEVVMR